MNMAFLAMIYVLIAYKILFSKINTIWNKLLTLVNYHIKSKPNHPAGYQQRDLTNLIHYFSPGLVSMSGQGSSSGCSRSLSANASGGGTYQPMDCESSPRAGAHLSLTTRRAAAAATTSSTTSSSGSNLSVSTHPPMSSAPASIDASSSTNSSSLIQSSLGSYNSLILPSIPHLPAAAMIGSGIHHHQQPSFYNYHHHHHHSGFGSGSEGHRQVVVPAQVVGSKQRADADREDSPMVGVCVQQSPVAIHWSVCFLRLRFYSHFCVALVFPSSLRNK